jgi:regulator of protease activity HflC (stomatin/prohibitin superfamily)
VDEHSVGLLYIDGRFADTLGPGRYAFWRNVRRVQVFSIERRETLLDIPGQEIMTADHVTLRLNAAVTMKVVDPRKSAETVDDARQTLYREAQLALRAMVGARELDALLTDKHALASELAAQLRNKAAHLGVEIVDVGVRDIILPGEMRELLNKVTEAKKAAEANLIVRREETAAMRSQANTAKLLENNPTLMRLREFEVLEKVAGHTKMQVLLGGEGLAERVVNLL